MVEYSFQVESFPEQIEQFDKKLKKMLPNVKSWSYSYATKTFTLELEEAVVDKIEQLKEVVKKCL